MQVFKLRLNSNDYQSFLPVDGRIWETDILKMDCKRKLPDWKSPEVYIRNPTRQRGNFLHLCSGAFVVDAVGMQKLRTICEEAGEVLPLAHGRDEYFLVNVLECANCLDNNNTKWVTGKSTGVRIRIENYHFDKSRFSESTLFKIPETAASEVLCVTGFKDPADEFKSQVEALGLKGLLFEQLWSD
jgi:hypothetical protein